MPIPIDLEQGKGFVNTSDCGECGGRLSVAWGGYWGINDYALRCGKDANHEGIKPKSNIRQLFDPDTKTWMGFNIVTQTPVATNQALTLPNTEESMAARINEAVSIGLFPSGKNVPAPTKDQLDNLAKIAVLYGLDPLMREIMPYQGQPYITIEGRRRIDARAGNHPTYKIRPMDKDTYDAYVAMGAINQGDVVVVGEFTDARFGNTIEATGRVLKSETTGSDFLPTVKWRVEMAHKRCEARGRKMLYGPVALPGGAESKMRMIETDDVLEGHIREIPDGELPEPDHQPMGNGDSTPGEAQTVDILGTDETLDPTTSPETYKAILASAGNHGLDLEGFCEQVLAQPGIAMFEKVGGTPAIAEKRLADWVKKQSQG